MKKRMLILGMLVVIAGIGYIARLNMNDSLDEMVNEQVEERMELEEKVYSESGFSRPFLSSDDSKSISDVRNLREDEFEALEGLEECTDTHMDFYMVNIEGFLENTIDEWKPGEWRKVDDDYYVVDYEDGTSSYRRGLHYYNMDGGKNVMEIEVEADAVSERIHNIRFCLPYEENARNAFTELLVWMGIDSQDAQNIFDKMLGAIHELGDNQRISYEEFGYEFYIYEEDYDDFEKMKKDKYYHMTISAVESSDN